jgi:hypothetical protein
MNPRLLAQTIKIGGQAVEGPLKLPGGEAPTLGGLVSLLAKFSIGAASVIMLLIFIWAGFDFARSRGNPQKIAAARLKVIYAIVGYILLVAAFLITRIVANIFGLGGGLFN